jgi:hypothetical protein
MRRSTVVAVWPLLAVLLTTACAGSSGRTSAPEGANQAATSLSIASPTSRGDFPLDKLPGLSRLLLRCGEPFRRPPGPQLLLTGAFPASVAAAAGTVAGRVDARAPAGGTSGVITPMADVFLVRDGRIATLPAPQDSLGTPLTLASGESKALPARAALVPCAPSRVGSALPPGRYEVWARLTVSRADGTGVDSFGGPWPLDIR